MLLSQMMSLHNFQTKHFEAFLKHVLDLLLALAAGLDFRALSWLCRPGFSQQLSSYLAVPFTTFVFGVMLKVMA